MPTTPLLLENRVALITGAGRGIGRAIALTYAQAGANVVMAARTTAQLAGVAAEVEAMGRQALPLVADISNPADVNRLVEAALAHFGQIDILVNNAAVAGPKPLAETSLEDWNRIIGVNLTGVFLCTQAVLPAMTRRRQGKILSVASGSGFRGAADNAAYSASKGGVVAFTLSVAAEVRSLGLQVNVISPGPIKTEMLAMRPAATGSPIDTSHYLETEDVAGLALYLASDYAKRITAQVFHVRDSARW